MHYANPAKWDYQWGATAPAELLAKVRASSVEKDTQEAVIRDARLAQCIHATVEHDEDALEFVDAALLRYQGRPGLDVALLRAIRCLVLISLRDPHEVLRSAPLITGTDPHRMEAAVFAQSALAMAYSLLGQPETAMLHLARAEMVAQLLGMRHRLRCLRIELARLRLQADHVVEPDAVAEEAETPHVNTRRFGNEVAAMAYMARGQFTQALDYGVARSMDELPLLYALAGVPAPEGLTGTPYALAAAQALRAAEAHDYEAMPHLPEGPHVYQRYTPILNGLRAVCGYSSLPNVDVAMGLKPGRADLRFLWNMVRLKAVLEDQVEGNPVQIADEILEDLRGLPAGHGLLALAQRLLPHQTLLLTYMPGAASVPGLRGVSVPLLTNDTVRGPVRMHVHGETADVLIGKALGINRVINTGFLSKLRIRLRAVGVDMDRMATVGHLYVWLSRLSQAASGTSAAADWAFALDSLLHGSPRLQEILRESIGETAGKLQVRLGA